MKRKRKRRSDFAIAFNLPRKRKVKAASFGCKRKKARYDTSKQASRRRSHSRRSERFARITTLRIRIMLIHRKRKEAA
jgi:hypothetical protein